MKVGTDCSGIDAPIQALKNLGTTFEHIFSSDNNKYAKKSLLANHVPNKFYDCITSKKEESDLDLYVCGFPCQPFSTLGKRLGKEDSRGTIFNHVLDNIKKISPKVFVLENVKGLLSIEKGEYFKSIISQLNEMQNYTINYSLLDTKDYGIPQNRQRVFIVGIRKDCIFKEFKWPEKIKETKKLTDYIDYNNTEKVEYSNTNKKKEVQFKDSIFANLAAMRAKNINNRVSPDHCPTITAGGQIFCTLLHRKATIKELLKLQGFPEDFKQVVSNSQMKKQIGNSMSVNVLEELFREIFKSTNFNN